MGQANITNPFGIHFIYLEQGPHKETFILAMARNFSQLPSLYCQGWAKMKWCFTICIVYMKGCMLKNF